MRHDVGVTDLRSRLADARLYLCTDGRRAQGDLPAFLDAVLGGGVDIVQLREKGLEAGEELALLEVFAAACRRHGALLAVNDRADVALAAGADVLHLGQDDLPLPTARRILGPGPVIGRSSHSPEQASAAADEDGIDYFCAGPVWATPTKPGRPGTGVSLVTETAKLGAGPAVVRDRRHRAAAAGRGAGGGGDAGGGGARADRGGRPGGGRGGLRQATARCLAARGCGRAPGALAWVPGPGGVIVFRWGPRFTAAGVIVCWRGSRRPEIPTLCPISVGLLCVVTVGTVSRCPAADRGSTASSAPGAEDAADVAGLGVAVPVEDRA